MPIYVPNTSFKLMPSRNIMLEEALLSKSASFLRQGNKHPTQFNLKE